MGGDQAANVLAQVNRDKLAKQGSEWPLEEENRFKEQLRTQYETQEIPIMPAPAYGMMELLHPRIHVRY